MSVALVISFRLASVAALTVAGGLFFGACDSSEDPSGSETPTSTTAIATEVESTPVTDVAPSTTARDAEPTGQSTVLQPDGAFVRQSLSDVPYVTSILTPTIEFSGAGEWLFNGEFEPLLLLSRRTGTSGVQEQVLNFVTFNTTNVDSVIDALQSDPILVFSDEAPSTLGGIDGVALTATAVVPGGGSAPALIFPSNLFISQVPLDPPVFSDGHVVRFTVLPIGDVVVVVLAGSDAASFDDHLTAADALLSTVTFSG